jgi:hypothetical protein
VNKIIILSVLVIAVIISASILLSNNEPLEPQSQLTYEAGFTYYDIEKIQDTLIEHDIRVTSPTAVTDHTINQYCTYFENGLPQSVEYCTTTAVLDLEGNTIGNINIGGDVESPILAIANLETIESDSEQSLTIFETMIKTLVCECWEQENSEDYPTIAAWVEATLAFYSNNDNRSIKSKIDNLADHEIILEITSKDDSVLQTLIILK